MAKGDDSRARNRIDQQGGLAQNHLDNLRNDMIIPQAQTAQNNFTMASQRGFQDYDKLMSGYDDWSKTGGYSPDDIANIRSRAVSPIRAAYANANRDVDRQLALQGGYSPGFGTLKARLARESSSGMSDAATNANAEIAQMVNSGKRFGMQGMSQTYGQTPGNAALYGGLQNQAMNNWLQAQGLQQNLGLGLINAQIGAAGIKGPWQQGFENTLGGIKTIGGLWNRG